MPAKLNKRLSSAALIAAGHLQGEANSKWLCQTTDAVRAWQKASEMQIDEIVNLDAVLFLRF